MSRANLSQGDLERVVIRELVVAWGAVGRAVSAAQESAFGRSNDRREFAKRLRVLRGCLLLAVGRVVDLGELEKLPERSERKLSMTRAAVRQRQARMRAEGLPDPVEVSKARRRYTRLAPLGFPDMSWGLAKIACRVRAVERRIAAAVGVDVPADVLSSVPASVAVRKYQRRKRAGEVVPVRERPLTTAQQLLVSAGFDLAEFREQCREERNGSRVRRDD